MQKILNLPFVDNSDFYPLCQAYASFVSYWNSITNVVSGRDVDNLLTNLIYQSVFPLDREKISLGARLLDVGSGAGIPGLPLKFARPDLQVTLLEPRRKKALFLQRAVAELDLKEVDVVCDRLENVTARPDWRAAFDLVVTRATGPAQELFPSMKPLLRSGGRCWFYKGLAGPDEAGKLSRADAKSVRLVPIDRGLYLIVVGV